jgi:hypothetical protein
MKNNEKKKYWNLYKLCNIGVHACQDFNIN